MFMAQNFQTSLKVLFLELYNQHFSLPLSEVLASFFLWFKFHFLPGPFGLCNLRRWSCRRRIEIPSLDHQIRLGQRKIPENAIGINLSNQDNVILSPFSDFPLHPPDYYLSSKSFSIHPLRETKLLDFDILELVDSFEIHVTWFE